MSLERVLVVDDDDDCQFLSSKILKKVLGDIEVIEAYDGVEAIELLNDNDRQPDVILLDINMPRMDGFKFLEQYSVTNPSIPPVVVMLTSSDQQSDKEKTLAYDCVFDYFIKPINKENINRLVEFFQRQSAKL
jgi:CheY-like chemotaxis protein